MKLYSTNSKKQPAKDFYKVAFPACSKNCAAVEHLGVGECESVCTHKHKLVNGLWEEMSQAELDKSLA
jgi:hypothetical protein